MPHNVHVPVIAIIRMVAVVWSITAHTPLLDKHLAVLRPSLIIYIQLRRHCHYTLPHQQPHHHPDQVSLARQSSSLYSKSIFLITQKEYNVHQGHVASTCLATGPAWLLFLALRAFLHKLYTCSTVTITLNQFSQVTFAMIRTPKY